MNHVRSSLRPEKLVMLEMLLEGRDET